MNESILSTIGHTPLVRLTHVLPDCPFLLFAKLEGFNPGGSAKDRPALHILQEAMRTGAVKAGSVVIESSSGNLGIGLAQACRYLGLRSEEHTSELQSQSNLVCRLLLDKKKNYYTELH